LQKMSEGEFKKRLLKHFKEADGWDTKYNDAQGKVCYESEILDWLDEVRKDIFSAIHVEYGTDTRRRDIDAIKLLAALDKWFGDKK